MQDDRTLSKRRKVLGTIEVRRGKLETLSLGVYDKGQPEPPVMLELEPEMSDYISVNGIRVLRPGDRYELLYQFQNYGSVTCRVTVMACL